MRVHVTDQLFGLEAFSRPMGAPPDAGDAAEAGTPVGVPMAASEAATVPEERETGSLTLPVAAVGRLVSRKLVLGLLVFLLAATVGVSMFTLVMKTRKKAASYELAHQTRLFRRMSKHRAIYELEYAYLRTNSPIQEELTRQGWREITPHDLTYIPVKRTAPAARQGGLTW